MNTSRLNILLVEDNEDDYRLTQQVLAEAFDVNEYYLERLRNAEQALTRVVESDFDILLFDDGLGEKNGIKIAKYIYSNLAASLPIIFLTKHRTSQTGIHALEAGISDCIRKQNLTADKLKKSILYAIARQHAQSALHESKLRINTMLNSMRDGVITSDQNGLINTANPAAAKLFGYSEFELINYPVKKLIPSLLSKTSFYKKYIDTRTETEAQHKDGSKIPIELSISEFTLDDEPMVTCIIHDISNRKKIELQIEHQAHYDPLTDLPNRRLLMDRLENSLKTSRRYNSYGALLFLDLDNFKHLNDSLGHSTGDNLLQQVAVRLTQNVRDSDTVARLGGDEFVVILTALDQDEQRASTQAHHIAEKVRREIGKTYNLDGHGYHFTPSIGIALYPGENNSADDILRHADSAMYLAKSEGRNTVRFYETNMQATADTRLQVEKELRYALQNNEFELHYQPQINSQGQLAGLEALVRWQHPRKGLIPPDDFLSIAEDACLMVDIGRWVMDTSMQQFADWRHNKLIPEKTVLAINVSPSQFNDKHFIPQVHECLEKSHIPAKNILLEITENLMIQSIESTISKMLVLKRQGIQFAIDDFGTGYSSLQYLKRLPISQIKIDKQFIYDFTIDPNNAAIVEAILSMAHHFDLEVVAEGIEAQPELYFLQAKGCNIYQGFFFSPPLSTNELETFMLENSCNNTLPELESEYLFDMSRVVKKNYA